MPRTFRVFSSIVALLLLLTACGESRPTPKPAAGDKPAAEKPAADKPAAAAATPAAPATPAAAQPKAAPAAAGNEIVFGAIHPLSGALAQDGAFLKNGIDQAVEEINAAGGISCINNGARLRAAHADSQGRPEVGQSEAERLAGEGVVALLGTYQSAVTLNASQVAEREKVPFIIDVTVANEILERGFKYSFRIQPDQTQMTLGLLEPLNELRSSSGQPIKTAAMLHEDSIFGTGFADLLKQLAPQHGLEVAGTISYSVRGLTDITTELSRVQALNPDIAIITGYLNDGILIARTAKDLQLRPPLVGLSNGAFSTQQFVDQVGSTAEYIMDANYHYDATKPRAREVRDGYRAKFNSDMPTHAVMAYESVQVLKDALGRACSTDRAMLRDALAQTKYENHILPYQGPIEFDEKGQAKNARSIVMQVQKGQIVQVAPSNVAEAKPVFPPPPWNQR
jgi:branched-chain amino acid transport system substrate-binding protein